MNDATATTNALHSVTLSTTAKGAVQIDVKVYADTPESASEQACTVLAATKDRLRAAGETVA